MPSTSYNLIMVESLPFPPYKPYSISLVLSGGGARGFAHIGVLKVLTENDIPISSICGCSMGGLIASLYAIGTDVLEIERIALKYTSIREMIKLVDLTPHRKGIIVSQRFKNFLTKFFDPNMKMEETKIPLYMNAVDLLTGGEVILNHGNLLDAVISTTAVPGVFTPYEIDEDVILADGGVLNNLPISIMRKFTKSPIVAVDVHHSYSNTFPGVVVPDLFRELYRAEMIMVREITTLRLKENPPDLLISPLIDSDINMFIGFQRVKELIQAGEEAARKKLEDIHKLLNQPIY